MTYDNISAANNNKIIIDEKFEGGVQHGPSIQDDLEQMRKESQEQATVRLKKPLSEMNKEEII